MIVLFGKRDNKYSYYCGIVIAILFSGLRYQNGNDYLTYVDIVRNIEDHAWYIEPGFYYFVKGLNLFPHPEYLMFFLFSAATISLIAVGINDLRDRKFAFFCYIIMPGLFLNSFHLIRQMLSVSIFFYVFSELIKYNNRGCYWLGMIIATAFHFTGILPFLVGYIVFKTSAKQFGKNGLISNPVGGVIAKVDSLSGKILRFTDRSKHLSVWLIFFVLLFSYVGSILEIPRFILPYFDGGKFEIYIDWKDEESKIKLIIFNMLTLFFAGSAKNDGQKEVYEIYLKIWLVGIVLLNLFSAFSPIVRITYYFLVFGLPLVAISTSRLSFRLKFIARSAFIFTFSVATVLSFVKLEQLLVEQGGNGISLLNYNFLLLQ